MPTEETLLGLTKEQLKEYLKFLWGQHLAGHNPVVAGITHNYLRNIDHQNFTAESKLVKEMVGEFSRMAAVVSLAATRQESWSGWEEMRKYLQICLEVITNFYPLSDSAAEAQTRGNFWSETYGGAESAQLITLRDVFHLAELLLAMLPDQEEVRVWSNALRGLIVRLSSSEVFKEERFSYIFLVEQAPYLMACQAYSEFFRKVNNGELESPLDQRLTVAARFAVRSARNHNPQNVIEALKIVGQVVKEQPSLIKVAVKELGKLGFQPILNLILKKKGQDLQNDQEIMAQVEQLLKFRYVGLGGDLVVTFNPK